MGKKSKVSLVAGMMAIASFVVAFIQGLLIYTAEQVPDFIIRLMLIIQNCINVFGFNAQIGLEEINEIISSTDTAPLVLVFSYLYAVVLFAGPYCTLVFVGKVFMKLLKMKYWRIWSGKEDRVVIFGYNEEVKSLLSKPQTEKRRVHLVADDVPEEEEGELSKFGVILHQGDCLAMAPAEFQQFSKKVELDIAKYIILFEQSSVRNFSLYHLLSNADATVCCENAKFFCRCEDVGIESLMEDYFDSQKNSEGIERDLEMISVAELSVRKMLHEHSLHTYHSLSNTPQKDDWNLHLLIVGFGKMGQQLLLQTMNQGVVTSQNKILIDVVDFNIEEKKNIFSNIFSDEYVRMEDNEFSISSQNDRADGEFKVRFHQMDIRYQQFYKLLEENGAKENGGAYTYIAICL